MWSRKGQKTLNNKKSRGISGATLMVFIIALFGTLWFTNLFEQREDELTWNQFEKLVTSDEVVEVTVNQNKNVPTGRVELRLAGETGEIKYLYVSDVNEIQDYLKDKGIDYNMPDVPQDSWFSTTLLPVLLMLAGIMFLFFMMNRQGGGANAKAMSFGKSRARLSTDSDKKITFAQVAGLQ